VPAAKKELVAPPVVHRAAPVKEFRSIGTLTPRLRPDEHFLGFVALVKSHYGPYRCAASNRYAEHLDAKSTIKHLGFQYAFRAHGGDFIQRAREVPPLNVVKWEAVDSLLSSLRVGEFRAHYDLAEEPVIAIGFDTLRYRY
jgi:hypothetical protein